MSDSTKKHRIWIESKINSPTQGVYLDESKSLLENLLDNRIEIDHSCGGNGTCATCCIEVLEGLENFSVEEEIEQDLKQERKLRTEERLSCQSFLKGTVRIKLP